MKIQAQSGLICLAELVYILMTEKTNMPFFLRFFFIWRS